MWRLRAVSHGSPTRSLPNRAPKQGHEAPRAYQAAQAYLAHQDSHLAPSRSTCRRYRAPLVHRDCLALKVTLVSQENVVRSARLGLKEPRESLDPLV